MNEGQYLGQILIQLLMSRWKWPPIWLSYADVICIINLTGDFYKMYSLITILVLKDNNRE